MRLQADLGQEPPEGGRGPPVGRVELKSDARGRRGGGVGATANPAYLGLHRDSRLLVRELETELELVAHRVWVVGCQEETADTDVFGPRFVAPLRTVDLDWNAERAPFSALTAFDSQASYSHGCESQSGAHAERANQPIHGYLQRVAEGDPQERGDLVHRGVVEGLRGVADEIESAYGRGSREGEGGAGAPD